MQYRLHDFRRGHAQDLLIGNYALSVILRGRDWRSSAFAVYLDTTDKKVSCVRFACGRLNTCVQAGTLLQRAFRDGESEIDCANVAQQSRVRKRKR